MENSELNTTVDLINKIHELREKYKGSRVGKDVDEQIKIRAEVEEECEKHKIDMSIIYLPDESFSTMTDLMMQKFILS